MRRPMTIAGFIPAPCCSFAISASRLGTLRWTCDATAVNPKAARSGAVALRAVPMGVGYGGSVLRLISGAFESLILKVRTRLKTYALLRRLETVKKFCNPRAGAQFFVKIPWTAVTALPIAFL